MHISPTSAYFLVKIQQLHRALSRNDSDFDSGLLHALDVHTDRPGTTSGGELVSTLQIPESVTTRVDGPLYVTDEGIEAIDVEIHYGTVDGGGKSVRHFNEPKEALLTSLENSQRPSRAAGK